MVNCPRCGIVIANGSNYCESCGLPISNTPYQSQVIGRSSRNRTDYSRVLMVAVLVIGALVALGMVTGYYSTASQQPVVVTQQGPPVIVQQPPNPPTVITVTSQTTIVQQNPPVVANNPGQCYAYDSYGNCVNYTPPTYYPQPYPDPTPQLRPWYQWPWHNPWNGGQRPPFPHR